MKLNKDIMEILPAVFAMICFFILFSSLIIGILVSQYRAVFVDEKQVICNEKNISVH